jgi:hypothetical protein
VAPPAPHYSSATVLEPEPAGALPNGALLLDRSKSTKAAHLQRYVPAALAGGKVSRNARTVNALIKTLFLVCQKHSLVSKEAHKSISRLIWILYYFSLKSEL